MKRIISIILALLMCISMVACTNNEANTENTTHETIGEQVENETIEKVEDETTSTNPSLDDENTNNNTEGTEGTETVTPTNPKEEPNESTGNDATEDVTNPDNIADNDKENNDESIITDNKTENGNGEGKESDDKNTSNTETTTPTDDVEGANQDKTDETTNNETEDNTDNEENRVDDDDDDDDDDEDDENVSVSHTPNKLEQDIFNLINQYRINAGLPELTFEYSFYDAAKTRATEAATVFSHIRPDGNNYTSVFAENGIKWDFIAGENVGRYFADAETAMNAFMDSQVHKDNILYTGYTRVCIAVVESEIYPGYYVIEQLFAGPKGEY